MRGETGRAAQSSLDTVQMGLDTARGGALISRLVSAALVAIGLSPLNDTGHVPEKLNARDARAAMTRLESLIARRPSWSDALQNERWMSLALFKQAIEKGNWRAPDAFTFGTGPVVETPGDVVLRRFTGKRTVAANINAAFDKAVTAQKAPYTPSSPDFALDLDPISRPLSPLKSQRFNEAREITQLKLMLLRFALRAYRLENGKFPPTLDALRGRYLQSIPTDDFAGGKPYRYIIKNGNYRLWSVGPDAVDDGGKAIVGRGFPGTPLPWQKSLPSMLPDSTGDVVAGEVR